MHHSALSLLDILGNLLLHDSASFSRDWDLIDQLNCLSDGQLRQVLEYQAALVVDELMVGSFRYWLYDQILELAVLKGDIWQMLEPEAAKFLEIWPQAH